MRTSVLVLATGALLALSAVPSLAGPCTNQISRLDRAMGLRGPGSEPMSTGSVHSRSATGSRTAKRGTHRYNDRVLAIEAALDRARFYDQEGKRRDCKNAVNEAERLMKSRAR